ncbi:MAG: hypothetical protein JW774_01735 [Candidatus Aureabacteria bacterium]|nr:hypothetical protein [Candidatus Auribacterota bacterium]
MKWMLRPFIVALFTAFLLPVWSEFDGFEFDVSYWRILNGETNFSKQTREEEQSEPSGIFDTAEISTTLTRFNVKTDASKYLFEGRYRFVDTLHRLTLGFQYATTGNAKVSNISIAGQPADIIKVFTDFSARSMKYFHGYAAYRLLPLNEDKNLDRNGIDVWLSWIQQEQDFRVPGRAYTLTSESWGVGLGGEHRIVNDDFSLKGRIIYLPFLNMDGSGWDIELRLIYHFSDYLFIYLAGKGFHLNSLEMNNTIQFTNLPKFTDLTPFNVLDTKLEGYVLGVTFRF